MVASNPIDKVSPVARTEERKHMGRMGRENGQGRQSPSQPIPGPLLPGPAPIQASQLSSPAPRQLPCPGSLLLNHPPTAASQPHLTSFLAARSQGPRLGAAQDLNEAGSVGVSHSCQGWRKGPHTAKLPPPLALDTSPEPRGVPP